MSTQPPTGSTSETPNAGPQTGLLASGESEGDSGTPGDGTGPANAKGDLKTFGFSASAVAPFVPVKFGFPVLWPDTSVRPIFFKFDYLLSEDADSEQAAFLRLSDAERAAETYRFDCRMIALLSAFPPEGLADFTSPRAEDDFDTDDDGHRKELAEAVFSYLYRPGSREEKAFAFVARQAMSRYWARVNPREYL
jgi:hypothetical protein